MKPLLNCHHRAANGKRDLRVVIVRGDQVEHRFYDFGEPPDRIDLSAKLTGETKSN